MERFWSWLSWKLPRKLVYFSTIRVAAHATTGKWSNQVVPKLTVMDAIDRWEITK